MKKISIILILIIANIIFFNKKIVEIYFLYKFSNWVEKKVTFDKFNIDYPDSITISGLKIINLNPVYYEFIFEAEKIDINFNLKTLLFDNLIIINHLRIEKPKFFLELIEKQTKSKVSIFEDNIGLAKKINENLPNKIWPTKPNDVNFLILKSNIHDGKAYIKVSSFSDFFETSLSDFAFANVGNYKEHQHYKSVLKIMLFDIYARIKNSNLKKLLKEIYNF